NPTLKRRVITMQVPFDENGSLIRHPHRYPNADEIVWEDAKPFQAHLILHDVRNAQGYGKYVIWREAHGIRRFPMDTEHAFVVVKHTLMDHGSVIAKTTPTWTFTKADRKSTRLNSS